TIVEPTAEGGFKELGNPQPIHFKNVEMLRKWIFDIKGVVEPILWVSTIHRYKIEENISAFFDKFNKIQKQYRDNISEYGKYLSTPGAIEDMRRLDELYSDIRILPDTFIKNLPLTLNIANNANINIEEVESYKDKHIGIPILKKWFYRMFDNFYFW